MTQAESCNQFLPPEQQALQDKCFHPSGTFVEFPIEDVETSVPARFEKIVQQYADNLAIASDSLSLTYSELNATANQLARAIIDCRPLGSEPIALLLKSRLDLVVAMLGVLKAGRCFVLLDPAFPKMRCDSILQDTGSKLLLVEGSTAAFGRDFARGRCRLLDIHALGAARREDDLERSVLPSSLASIAYTSGSSGTPKGVLWTHRNMLHQVMLFTNAFHHCDRDRLSYLTAGTSAAVIHPFFALLVGAAVLPFDLNRGGILAFGRWLVQERISICSLSTPLFRSFAESLTDNDRFPDLRLLRLSSEAACKGDFELYRRRFPSHCLLANGVGPAETCLLSTYLMDHNSEIASHEIPIGYPVQDKDILLVNDAGVEVGFNQIGEIVVRSDYLAPGYWNRPDLTDEKFQGNDSGPGPRLFLTGDLALRLIDGCLIHKGRKDFRAKIRGYGVEPAEVEAVLRQHPEVRETCVLVKPNDVTGEHRLIAYITANAGMPLASSEVRNFLNKRLPPYMIPSVFVMLEVMPLTINGKVDRSALPSPEHVRSQSTVPYSAPKNIFEDQISKIWCEVLGLDRIGTDDNFFDLGGNSLSAMRVIVRLRDALCIEIPIMGFFETPTIGALADLIGHRPLVQSGAQIASLRSKLKQSLPLSFGQERLWFLEQLEPQACRHNLVAAFRLTGDVDTAALKFAVNEIVNRHESLHTVFRSDNGRPYQVITEVSPITLSFIDISRTMTKQMWEQEISRICASEGRRPMDLTKGPLLRAIVARSANHHSILILVVHHLVFDGWSMEILTRELVAGYEAALSKRPLQLPSVPIRYADFAVWQRASLQGESLDAHLSFWRDQLKGISDLRLPADHSRLHLRDGKATRQWFTVSYEVSRSLKEISHQAGATLFMTLLAAYQVLLYRYSGQDDFCIGVPMAGRQHQAWDNTIGFFLNMLVLRADVAGDPTFIDMLDRVRRRCLEAYAHQDLPFERLVEDLQPRRDLNQNPLFQVSFTFRNSAPHTLQAHGLTLEEIEIDPGTSRFDLELFIEEGEQGLHGFIAGSADLVDAATIGRMVGHFKNLLDAMSADPSQRIGTIALLDEAEKRDVLLGWNDTSRNQVENKLIQQLFEEQVQRTPNAVAGIFKDRQLTYGALNRRANQLAYYLMKLGVGPEVLVGLCVERSLEMIIGLLGILKAGGAYVPLDPEYPKERLAFMLEDAKVSILLTQESLLESGEPRTEHRPIQRICLDRDWESIARERDANPQNTANTENLAYVIYTSGSTGQPKGVAIEQRNTVAFLEWVHSVFTPDELSGVLASTSICFDLSVFEIFAPLTCGGTIIMAENALALATIPDASKVSLLNTVPSAMTELLNLGVVPSSVAVVNLAGETLQRDLVRRIYESTSVRTVYDLYGPTECTTYSTWAQKASDSPNTIGRPISNTQIYILDRYLAPVPIGIVGEIWIGGEGLARGYLNQPKLTAERFIHHSFDGGPQHRLYRTGDLGRYLPNGNIEFLGRIDHQVKIRGYRIELGEIEAVLGQHPMIETSVVGAREDTPGDKRLVGYVVPRHGITLAAAEIRKFLKQKLPNYMIPSQFALLDALPLTANGKVNRAALPAPVQDRPELENAYRAPRTTLEKALAAIWSELLKVENVGIYDNFFELGGHSLLAIQIMSRVRSRLSVELPLRTLFESPTVAGLALVVEQTRAKGVDEIEWIRTLRDVEALTEEEATTALQGKLI